MHSQACCFSIYSSGPIDLNLGNKCDSDLFSPFSRFHFLLCLYRLKPEVAWHNYDVLIKSIMKIMRLERLSNPATYWVGNVGK